MSETERYLDKECREEKETIPPDYQKFLDNDINYRIWLDDINEQTESPF